MDIFSSPQAFRQVFRSGLVRLVQAPALTPAQLVLVLGNAISLGDHDLLAQAKQRAHQLPPTPATSAIPTATDEDNQAIAFILAHPNPLNLIHRRTTPAGWRLLLNDLRARRPRRSAAQIITTNHQPYDSTKFNFNRVPDETFWVGEWRGQAISLFYNKYPIEPYHAILVPEPAAQREQYLRATDHQLAWSICQELAPVEPDIVVAFNALGTFASVNHLHFQTMFEGNRLPILRPGGLEHYPIPVQAFADSSAAWRHIDQLQATHRAFNLVYAPGRCLVIPRRFQGYSQPDWTTGFAWYELSGGILTSNSEAYQTLTDADIDRAMRQAAL